MQEGQWYRIPQLGDIMSYGVRTSMSIILVVLVPDIEHFLSWCIIAALPSL